MLAILSSFFVSQIHTQFSPLMRKPERKHGPYALPSRTDNHGNLIPRVVLSAIILIAIFLVYRLQPGGSTANEPVARAHQETESGADTEPTETPPNGVRQALKATPRMEEQTPAGARSDASPPISDVGMVRSFRVDDPHAYVYTVRIGEFWDLIAERFYSTTDRLKEANLELWLLRGEEIQPGDQMVIPGLAATDMIPPTFYSVEEGDSWDKIADTFSLTFLDLLLDNFDLWAQRGVDIQSGDSITINHLAPALAKLSGSSRTALAAADTPSNSAVEPPSSEQGTYVVQQGDTWELIAAETGISMLALKKSESNACRPGAPARRCRPRLLVPACRVDAPEG